MGIVFLLTKPATAYLHVLTERMNFLSSVEVSKLYFTEAKFLVRLVQQYYTSMLELMTDDSDQI